MDKRKSRKAATVKEVTNESHATAHETNLLKWHNPRAVWLRMQFLYYQQSEQWYQITRIKDDTNLVKYYIIENI